MRELKDLPAWERLFKKIVWKQLGDIKDKYILGEKVPIIMDGLYLDRYLISNDSRDSDGKNIRLNNYFILLLLISLLS